MWSRAPGSLLGAFCCLADLLSVRVVVAGCPGSGCEEVAEHVASILQVPCINATEVQLNAHNRYKELKDAQRAKEGDGEGSDAESEEEEEELDAKDQEILALFAAGVEGGGAAPLLARLKEVRRTRGCVSMQSLFPCVCAVGGLCQGLCCVWHHWRPRH